ncbi:MAG: arylsulfatase [Alphaproteobacteria bacterium]|nr:arylsulfatase [Alphaproteobacteria bacterium]
MPNSCLIFRFLARISWPALVMIAIASCFPVATGQTDPRPNVVVILVDDAALMDFGAYGGEARTPNIDAFAARGAMFLQYRTSPLCSPTRAMLLTGMDNHRTGVATIPEVLPEEHVGRPGYTMAFEPGVLTLADRLGAAGYRTMMSGKWHLGDKPEEMPQAHGFQRSFALAASGADNWDDKSYMPFYADAPWFENGVEASLPKDFYSSRFIVDKMIDYLEDTDKTKPFFAYLPFQAIHIPVQAPPEFTAHYKGRYHEGWHVMRAERHQRAQSLGLVSMGAPLAPMPETARQWDALSEKERALYAARMEVNAGMLEAMDRQIGRFIDHLKAENKFEHTIFVITSDNGPEFNRGDDDPRLAFWMSLNGYHVGLDGMGERGSWGFIGPEWANAAASPGALFKFYATEGGIRAPLIVAGPGVVPQQVYSPAMVTDLAPTLLDLINGPSPPDDARAMTGRSLLPVLTGEANTVYAPDDVRAIEVSGNAALYKGDYKITRSMPPVGDGAWRLFNMLDDPGETTDLSAAEPEMLANMLTAYTDYASEMGVLDMPADYNSLVQIERNTQARLLRRYGWHLAALGLVLLAFLYGIYHSLRVILRRARA